MSAMAIFRQLRRLLGGLDYFRSADHPAIRPEIGTFWSQNAYREHAPIHPLRSRVPLLISCHRSSPKSAVGQQNGGQSAPVATTGRDAGAVRAHGISERTACLSDVRVAFDQLHAHAHFADSN